MTARIFSSKYTKKAPEKDTKIFKNAKIKNQNKIIMGNTIPGFHNFFKTQYRAHP